jgi:hypothetical protein
MQKLYYYEYSDDGEQWRLGESATSLFSCIDKAQKCCYSWRIKRVLIAAEQTITQDEIDPVFEQLRILEKLFQ